MRVLMEACMQTQTHHPLEPFFQQVVRDSYEGKLGLHDPDVIGYVSRVLCDFSDADTLFKTRDTAGHAKDELDAMMLAADPVHGTAPSFDAERAMRRYIGDYSLFVAGRRRLRPVSQPTHPDRGPPRGERLPPRADRTDPGRHLDRAGDDKAGRRDTPPGASA